MSGVAVGLVILLVVTSTLLHVGVATVLLWKLALEGSETRQALGMPMLPIFFQNLGIPLAILGFAVQSTDLALAGALLIGIGLAATSEQTLSLHPELEARLLTLAALAFASVGLLHGLS